MRPAKERSIRSPNTLNLETVSCFYRPRETDRIYLACAQTCSASGKKGADPEQTDPSLKKIEALYETIVTAWGAITQMWYGVNSSKRVPTGKDGLCVVFCAYTTDSGLMYLGQVPILF